MGYIAVGLTIPAGLGPIAEFALFAVSVAAAVFVFKLSLRLFGTGVGVVLGILTLVPLLGLIVPLVINGKATAVLQRHGLKIGLLGRE